ncbi:50S ribosomal protein L28 [Hypericibacter terrae]|jgi:large subunit ribosomal protein L28|uniref:Large ribosomal subunit protein bL28 n=1 Tax=Hypericibacter terrae TaxID=2602015 RepID=A0A5J6MPE7_9PROT|nr:50S ribosomal protein L28 [Hypericibacter terrae]QEX19199.1 50S ribosomal protein L28 [Hypericibacter terrae]
MARRCPLTGKGIQSGHNVSHANNKTKRRFMPNLQQASLTSDALGGVVHIRLSVNALRTVEHNGGIDAYLLGISNMRLSDDARRLKKRIEKALAKQQAAA